MHFALCLAMHALSLFPGQLPGQDIEPPPLAPRVEVALETIDADDVHSYIAYLASNALMGRNAGMKGNDLGADWIAEFFGEMALSTGGADGTFFQYFTFDAGGSKKNSTRNVIALYRGCDPVLKDEAIVIGAHFDHVGAYGEKTNPARLGRPTKSDGIWNGADDNASGTSAVMEIAQAFALARIPVKRTIVFVCFSAEEHGLYGSTHYVEHPVIPLERTSAMINLDMVGRNPKRPVMVFGLESDEDRVFQTSLEQIGRRLGTLTFRQSQGAYGGSDHWPFMKKGIPSVFFFTGYHKDYHHIGDEVDKISCDRVRDIARTAFLLAVDLADRKGMLVFDGDFGDQARTRTMRRRLGIDVDQEFVFQGAGGTGLADDQGAVRISGVYAGSVADRAGLKSNDLILSVGSVLIRREGPLDGLREAIRSAPAGTEIPIIVLRRDEIITLQAQWADEKK